MKRIHKERDRVLRSLARVTGITGALGALACLLVPGTATNLELAVGVILSLGACALITIHTTRGAVLPALGVVACALTLVAVLGSASVLDAAAATAIAISGGGALSSVHTTVLMTVEETLEALRKASSIAYRPPGA